MARLSDRVVLQMVREDMLVLVNDQEGWEIQLTPAEVAGLEWFVGYFRLHGFGQGVAGAPCGDCVTDAGWRARAIGNPNEECGSCGRTPGQLIRGEA